MKNLNILKVIFLLFIFTSSIPQIPKSTLNKDLSLQNKIKLFKKVNKLPKGFVYLSDIDPTIQQSIRYGTDNNFVGRPIKGYKKPICILTRSAAVALSKVQMELKKKYKNKYSLKIYDAYRPKQAVKDFWKWSLDIKDKKMKDIFYPDIKDKRKLFKLGYVARISAHSRGSSVDVTIIDTSKDSILYPENYSDNSIKMGTIFDFFSKKSHAYSKSVSLKAQQNRKILREIMEKYGFVACRTEWWHFTLKNEPFPKTYFDFIVE